MLIILASWVNRQQQEIIEYRRIEDAVLKEKLGKKQILLTAIHRGQAMLQRPLGGQARSRSVWFLVGVRYEKPLLPLSCKVRLTHVRGDPQRKPETQ